MYNNNNNDNSNTNTNSNKEAKSNDRTLSLSEASDWSNLLESYREFNDSGYSVEMQSAYSPTLSPIAQGDPAAIMLGFDDISTSVANLNISSDSYSDSDDLLSPTQAFNPNRVYSGGIVSSMTAAGSSSETPKLSPPSACRQAATASTVGQVTAKTYPYTTPLHVAAPFESPNISHNNYNIESPFNAIDFTTNTNTNTISTTNTNNSIYFGASFLTNRNNNNSNVKNPTTLPTDLILQQRLLQQQREQKILQEAQLRIAAAAIKRHQEQQLQQHLVMAAINNTNQCSQDEISNSLKQFALFQAVNESLTPPQSPIDDVMIDFALNGYSSDELQRYQQIKNIAALNYVANNLNNVNCLNINQNITNNLLYQQQQQQQQQQHQLLLQEKQQQKQQQQQQQQQLFVSHYQEMWRQNFNKNLANAAAAIDSSNNIISANNNNSDLNSNASNNNNNNNNINFNSNHFRKATKHHHNNNNNHHKKEKQNLTKHCVFCENNNEPDLIVKSHAVRDSLGRVLCPKLRTYVCPICGASGDSAHTVKYCPRKPIITMEDAIKAESLRLARINSAQSKPKMQI